MKTTLWTVAACAALGLGLTAARGEAATLVYSTSGLIPMGANLYDILPAFSNEFITPTADETVYNWRGSIVGPTDTYTVVLSTDGTMVQNNSTIMLYFDTGRATMTNSGWEWTDGNESFGSGGNINLVNSSPGEYTSTFSFHSTYSITGAPVDAPVGSTANLFYSGQITTEINADFLEQDIGTPYTIQLYLDAAPEPSAWLLTTTGVALLGWSLRRRRCGGPGRTGTGPVPS